MRFYLAVFLCLVLACNNKNELGYENPFQTRYSLTGTTIIDQSKLLDPTLVSIIDSFIIVSNYKGEPLIELYSNRGEPIKKTVHLGSAPHEILSVGGVQVENENSFFVNDLFAKKVLKIDLKGLLNENNYVPEVYFNLLSTNNSDLLFDKVLIGDEIIICESRSPKGRLIVLDSKGELLYYYLPYPEIDAAPIQLNDFQNAQLYSSTFCISPEKDKLAMATYSAGMIDLLKIDDDSIEPIWSYNEFYASGIDLMEMGGENVIVHTNNSRKGYLHTTCSSNFVYALFSGKKLEDESYPWGNIIRVVSWDGEQTFEFELDRLVKRIVVDLNDSVLYAVGKNAQEEPEIVRFEINDFIKNEASN